MFVHQSSAIDSPSPSAVKPRLGLFEDIYSPQHLNYSPIRTSRFQLQDQQNRSINENAFSVDRSRTLKARKFRTPAEVRNCSFEGNQSFPGFHRPIKPKKMELDTPPSKGKLHAEVRVDGPNGLRFNSSLGCYISQEVTPMSLSQIDRLQSINPNKAVFTIEPKSTKILIVNNKACSLLGYTSGDLCNTKFIDLIRDKKVKQLTTHNPDEDLSDEGTIIVLSGKVVELLSSDGESILVSLWIRQLENDGPVLVVAEPVNYKQVVLSVDNETGLIQSCDSEDALLLFQVECLDKLVGQPISSLVPSIVLPPTDRSRIPKTIAKQKATGRTIEGGCFPLCLWISRQVDLGDSSKSAGLKPKEKGLLEVTIRVTYNVSGLLVVDESGTITACNHHFSMLTFGKRHQDVIGRPVEELIPNFCRDADAIKVPATTDALSPLHMDNENSESDTDPDSCGAFNGSQKSACTSLNVQTSQLSHMTRDKSISGLCLDKSTSLMTHTPTPTQDMISSLSTTEHRNDTSAFPDVTSGMSGISIEEDPYSSISKSRSENLLRSEIAIKSDSIYYSEDTTPTASAPKVRQNDPAFRLSFDSSKFRKANNKDDRSSLSLDFCDSNETSADFLTPINEMPTSGCEIEDLPKHNGNETTESYSQDLDTQTESSLKKIVEGGIETPVVIKRAVRNHLTTSTPQAHRHSRGDVRPYKQCDRSECSKSCQHKDGTYKGIILHKDGTELGVIYTVSSMQLATGSVQCVWLGVQLDDMGPPRHTTLASSINSTADNSLVFGNKSFSSRPQSMSLMSQCGDEQISGDYSKLYVTLKQIGKGAYGCVKMAYRRTDRLLVIAKFITKDSINAQFWTDSPDNNGKKIPLEVSLLLALKHTNIVSVLDVFENDKYFQMVMEKHGAGMDLFEFIERRPQLDELLVSYIFRQIGQAVEYLHSLNILHRDIKDENVIIDNKFHVKLIDFGSATFMSKDTLFSTFYGTTEYCSPEVLAGNKYAGPELEMWSMGITLYVLTFFMNPFSDIEDTIQGPLMMITSVSEELEHLLRWMLCKDPAVRCTIPQLMTHPWIKMPVQITDYVFQEIVDCDWHANTHVFRTDRLEANPEVYYSGSCLSPKSASLLSLAEAAAKERSNPSDVALRQDGKSVSKEEPKRSSLGLQALSAADREAHSDNYSLRSSADILDISSKPVSEAALTDISSDATGHAACDIDYDCDQLDSWDEQDSFS